MCYELSSEPLSGRIARNIRTFFPIVGWLPTYSWRCLQRDLIAGVTVSLMIIPQSIAYTSIIGLPPQFGLYSAFMGTFVYSILGPTKEMFLGPSALLCLAVVSYKNDATTWPTYTVIFTLLGGIVQLTMGLFGLGSVVNLISLPVTCGFTSSIAVTVGVSQVQVILGLDNTPRGFFPLLLAIFNRIGETNIWDLLMGIACIIWLISFKLLDCIKWSNTAMNTWLVQLTRKVVRVVILARNASVVLLAVVAVLVLERSGHVGVFTLSSQQSNEIGVPAFQPPALSIISSNKTESTLQILSNLGSGIAVIPLVAFLETVAVAKTFARLNSIRVHAGAELVALGVANCLSSFVSSFPICGSFTRATVSSQSGVATPAAGIFSSSLVLLALTFLQPYFMYIPKASLAALVLVAVSGLFDLSVVKKIWKVNKIEVLPFFVTFFGCMYRLDIGIFVGVSSSLVVFLYMIAHPLLIETNHTTKILQIVGDLTFPGTEHIVDCINELMSENPNPGEIFLSFKNVTSMDFTGLKGLMCIITGLERMSVKVYYTDVRRNISVMMTNAGIENTLINPDLELLNGCNTGDVEMITIYCSSV